MPLSDQDLVQLLRGLPKDAPDEVIKQAAAHAEQGHPLQKIWEWANRPLVGGEDSPVLAHKHADDEGFVRRTAEDLGASLTSPVSLATTALGVGATAAGAKGLLGISKAARAAEAGLQVPFVAEGLHKIVSGESAGEKLGGALEAGLGAHGVKTAATHAFEPKAVVKTYIKEKGISPSPREPFNEASAMKTADDYVAMPHEPNNPAVKASYNSLKSQVDEQHKFLAERAGVKIEPWSGAGEPYPNSDAMRQDVLKNNHLYFLATDAGVNADQLPLDHPMAEETASGLANDKFRAVHDYFGHTAEKNSFGPKGEQEAYNAHKQSFSGSAIPALTTETRGQNSFVNAGPHLRNEAGVLPKKGEPGFVPLAERPFAPQKAGILPEQQPQPSAAELADSRYGASSDGATPRSAPNVGAPASQTGQSALPALSDELAAVINESHQRGGSTASLTNQRLLTQDDGRYMVSPFQDRQLPLENAPTPQDLRNYIAKNEDLLAKPGHNLGTWWNKEGDGKHYLDVSITENDLNKAMDIGRQHKQLAIYDMVEGKDVPIEQAKPTVSGSTALAVAAPAAATQIDDSDPNDPHQQLKHYGKLALDVLGAAGLGNTALGAPIRKIAQSPQKAAAAKGAAYMLLGGSKADWMKRMAIDGVSSQELPKIRAASEKMLTSQMAKAETQMPNTKKLMQHFESGRAEMGWYDDVHKELTHLFGKDADMVAQLLAATSSNATVKSNVSFALKAYLSIKAGEPVTKGYLPVVVKQINRVAAGEGLEGRKIDNFAKALMGDPNAVVVDRWMLRAFGFDKEAASPHEYDVIEHAVKELAQKQGVTPRQMQASIWFSVKNKTESTRTFKSEAPPYGRLLGDQLQSGLK